MKILHVITSLRTGGAEHLMVDLLPLLAKYGHTVHLLLFDGTKTPFYEQLESKGITIYSLSKGVKAMHNPWLVFKLRRFLKQYDFVHTHNTPCQLLVAFASYGTHTQYITTEHSTSNKRRAWAWYRNIDRWMYGRYKRIICVSEKTETLLREHLACTSLTKRMLIIENGINLETIQLAKPNETLQKQYANTKRIVMVAAFRAEKDQDTLIRSMVHLSPQYHLFLVGEGVRKKQCQALVASLNLTNRVHFMGIRTDIPTLLKAADVVVLSSHYEGLSLSSIEGMASGEPFLASNVPGLKEIVGGYGVLFEKENHKQLAELIVKMSEDCAERNQVIAQCLARAKQFDVKNMAQKYIEVYK